MSITASSDYVATLEQHMAEVRQLFTKVYVKVLLDRKETHAQLPISTPQLKTLLAFQEGRTYTMGQISSSAMVTLPSMTGMIDRLFADEFVERVKDPKDRRIVLVKLTEKGVRVRNNAVTRSRQELGNVLNLLDSDDSTELLNSLEKAARIIRKVSGGSNAGSAEASI